LFGTKLVDRSRAMRTVLTFGPPAATCGASLDLEEADQNFPPCQRGFGSADDDVVNGRPIQAEAAIGVNVTLWTRSR
jgi:hypothetical protein